MATGNKVGIKYDLPDSRSNAIYANRLISQIPKYICSIPYNAPFRIEKYISILNGALWDMEQVHYGILIRSAIRAEQRGCERVCDKSPSYTVHANF